MPDVTFRIDGLARGRVRVDRRKRRLRDRSVVLAVAAAVVAVLAIAHSRGAFDPTAVVNGIDVRGRHVLVLLDDSGSMPRPPVAAEAQIRALAAAGISVDLQDTIRGSALSYVSQWSLFPQFFKHIDANPSLDTLYVVSDFEDYTDNQDRAVAAFIDVVRSRRLRVYWATVNNDPPPLYHQIARDSGGGVIPPR